jgi:hypothetical protein
MRVLYVVFVVSLVALVWTVFAVKRHIRDHDAEPAEPLHLTGGKNDDPLENLE